MRQPRPAGLLKIIMLYSKSSQYAIRSLVHLASQPTGRLHRIEEIATQEEIPHYFLAKILQRLARKRFVRSVKGVNGGFALSKAPEELNLYVIVDAIDDLSVTLTDCVMGNTSCSDTKSCLLHEGWTKLKNQQIEFLQQITIADLAATAARKKEEQDDRRKI